MSVQQLLRKQVDIEEGAELTQEVLGRVRVVVRVFGKVVDLFAHPLEVSCRDTRRG